MTRMVWSLALLLVAVSVRADEQQFESEVRPVLIDHCLKCHGQEKSAGGLRLDSRAGLRAGGDSGTVVVENRPDESLLWQRIEAGEMPPATEPRLTAQEKSQIRRWISEGAAMPEQAIDPAEARDWRRLWSFRPVKRQVANQVSQSTVPPLRPDHESLKPQLEAWYRADDLQLGEWDEVTRWPDRTVHQRDLVATRGAHSNGLGGPTFWIPQSSISGKPAVRFVESTGLGSPGDKPIPLSGDAGLTLSIVCRLQPRTGGYPHDLICSLGEFAAPGDPGRPLAAALGIQRTPGADHRLSFVGGWGHDGLLAPGSFAPLYFQTCLLTVIKSPGPVSQATQIFINGIPSGQVPQFGPVTGSSAIPDYQERQARDFSLMLGNSVNGAGGILGDIAEVIVYSRPLSDSERQGLEAGLLQEYGIDTSPMEHPIDAFIKRRLQQEQLPAAGQASRQTLIRRASFDLLGLPPSPEQVEKFVHDPSPNAWESLIVELLASPHYGERYARHWLDVARYADSGGYETDMLYRQAWRYRDYVVKSFNDDKPWDRLVQEQIAGDELWPNNLDTYGPGPLAKSKERALEAHLGTGFFALGPQIHESNADAPLREYERLTDQVDAFGSAFLGLTLGCARCHDHKFDPLTQHDYYALQAVFSHSCEGERAIGSAMDLADLRQHYPRVQAVVQARRAYRLHEQTLAGRTPTADEEQQRQRLLSAIGQRVLEIPENSAQGRPFDGLLEMPTTLVLEHQRPELVKPVRLLARGELSLAKERVDAGLPAALAEATGVKRDLPDGLTSRKELALWLTRPEHPLTARVIVNRVWKWHFGVGIVSTPNDFGRMGQPPTHPELLDWLTADFIEHGWSLKRLHRLIMTSQAYQRASDFATEKHLAVDPENKLLWRAPRRRLEGEAIWDAIHAAAGTLTLDIGGPPVMPPITDEERSAMREPYRWQESPDPRQHSRRGLYVITYRNFRYSLFDVFDAPNNALSVGSRDNSTVAPQTLWLLNHPIVWSQTQKLAERVLRESTADESAQVDRLWRIALGRPPTESERRAAITQLQSSEPSARATNLSQLSLALFNHNEFVFID